MKINAEISKLRSHALTFPPDLTPLTGLPCSKFYRQLKAKTSIGGIVGKWGHRMETLHQQYRNTPSI